MGGNDVMTNAACVNGVLGVPVVAVTRTTAGDIFVIEMMIMLRHSRLHHLAREGQDGQNGQQCAYRAQHQHLRYNGTARARASRSGEHSR